ncbi:hypothetical protein JCM10213_005069 [Rhodosporidiobolus nylandii]
MLFSVLTLATLALSAAARPTPSGTEEYIHRRSTTTPAAKPPAPHYQEDAKIMQMISAMAAAAKASAAVKSRRGLDNEVDVDLQRRDVGGDTLLPRDTACLDSSANDTTINALFYYGGAGTTVELCPGANIQLTNAIFFTAENQVLTTQGNPTGDTRATIIVAGSDQSCAIYGACDACSGVSVQNIQVAGSRDTLGRIFDGIGLLEMGGNTVGQKVTNCHIYEPRGWSALHAIEGYQNSCSGMTISNNQVGPSGHSPTNGYQFRKRDDDTTVYEPGAWADGISLACKGSSVTGNTVTDCTDGGIVIFGAPGSTISGNTIIAQTRRPLGGINAVDYSPFGGSFEGTVVEDNTFIADTNMIKIGIALGGMSWGSDNRTASRTFGGTFRNNHFKSGSSGYFGYAISVAGHNNANVYGNDASGANFGGDPSVACIPWPMVPTSQAFVYDQWTTPGGTLQSNFVEAPLVFLICQEPGPIVGSGNGGSSTGTFLVGQQGKTVNASSAASSSAASSTLMSSSVLSSTSTVASSSASSTMSSTLASSSSSSSTTTTTQAPKTTTTSAAKSTSTTSTKPKTTRQIWRLSPAMTRILNVPAVVKTTTTTTKPAPAKTTTTQPAPAKTSAAKIKWYLSPYKRWTETGARQIIQDGDDEVEKRDLAPRSKATPAVHLVNPFAALEQVARLR